MALVFALDASTKGKRLLAWAVLGAACGAGFMTKGFLAFVLPVLVALPFMLWQRRLGEMVRGGALAIAVAALVSLPWVLTVHGQEADFWNFFFWNEVERLPIDGKRYEQGGLTILIFPPLQPAPAP